jgi:hypothetical protein
MKIVVERLVLIYVISFLEWLPNMKQKRFGGIVKFIVSLVCCGQNLIDVWKIKQGLPLVL